MANLTEYHDIIHIHTRDIPNIIPSLLLNKVIISWNKNKFNNFIYFHYFRMSLHIYANPKQIIRYRQWKIIRVILGAIYSLLRSRCRYFEN